MGDAICHVEVPVTDLERAKRFYSEAFGWDVELVPGMEYALFKTGSEPGGGFAKVEEVRPGGALFYILVKDLEEKLREIERAGGKRLGEKAEIEGIGWEAKFIDVFGNILGLFKPVR